MNNLKPKTVEVATWTYKGHCSRCGKGYFARLQVLRGIIAPPAINLSCNCAIPVTGFEAIYTP